MTSTSQWVASNSVRFTIEPEKLTNIRKSIRPQDDSAARPYQAQTKTKANTTVPGSVKPTVSSRGIGDRLQWPLPRWSSRGPTQLQAQSQSRPRLHIQPYPSNSLDCKACREWHVACDHSRPQCEHCYQQQILCFYVSPNQKPIRKAKRLETSELVNLHSGEPAQT